MGNKLIERIRSGEFVLIAEIGVNYYDIATERNITPLDAAKLMIFKAKEAGVHAVKFQSYKAELLAAKDSPAYWDTSKENATTQFSLFKRYDSFGEDEYRQLKEYCEKLDICFMSTAFDMYSADYLEPLLDIYKISSSDLNNMPFIAYQAKKNTPIILSTGASNNDEIRQAVELIRKYNDKEIILMHCVLEYPTPYEHANLNKIVTLKKEYPDLIIGYSDHTRPDKNYDVLKTAFNLGATVIEKHFTLNKNLCGNDHYHAMDDEDAREIIRQISYIEVLRGQYTLTCLETEKKARLNARRSLVSNCRIPEGTVITHEMLTYKRPANGISVDAFYDLIGKRARCDIEEGLTLMWEMFE